MKRLGYCIAFTLVWTGSAFGQATITTILTNGPTANRLNFVFLSEGFTATELGTYLVNATNFINKFLTTQPYSEYKTYINAFAISVASAESGSDHPSQGIFKDTYFNSSFDSYATERLLTIPPNDLDFSYSDGQGKVDSLLMSLMPEFDIPIVLVNDEAYGGSGGATAVASLDSSARDIAIHEVGHSFAHLGDEYGDPYDYPDTEEPNTTKETRRQFIKWNAWIDISTPLPTPTSFTTRIGLFEGAHYHDTGWFRPKFNCRMRALNASFCAVCAEALVESIYGRISGIDSYSPATNVTYSITNETSVTFTITPLKPDTHQLKVQWLTNDVIVVGADSGTFTIRAVELTAGANTVKTVVTDSTSFVRTDPAGLLQDTRTWKVKATISIPKLSARLNDGVVLSYPTNFPDFFLESATTVAPGTTWMKVTKPASVSGGRYTVVLPIDQSQQFFRLKANAP